MSSRLNPYLNFRGQAKEAMAFYQSVFGGELESNTFAEGGMPIDDSEKDQVMHAQLLVSESVVIMGADVPSSMDFAPMSGTSVCLNGDDDALLRGWWDGLSEGAEITMPLEVAPWGDAFGGLTDKFGTVWIINITSAPAA